MSKRRESWSNRTGRVVGSARLQRREFLKYVAAAGAAGTLSGVAPLVGGAAGNASLEGAPHTFAWQEGDQRLTIGLSLDPGGTIDPRIVWNIPNISAALNHIYEPLVKRSETLEIVPVLAESWEWEDELSLVLHLRQGVSFHNGEPFTAESVKFTIESIYDPDTQSPIGPLLPVDGAIEIVDDHTAKFVLQEPFRPLPTILPWALMMPPQAASEGTNFASTAIGTGPYRFTEYRPSELLIEERNPDYWGDQPLLDEITIRFIPENGTRVASLETGEILMMNNVPPDQLERINSTPGLEILSSDTSRVVYLAMMCDRPPFDDVRVRQAVAYAIDRDALVQAILQGYGQVADAPLSPFAQTYRSDLPPYAYDPERARALLQEAGLTEGTPVKFGAPSGRYLMDKQIAEATLQFLQDIGLNATLEATEFGVYWPKATGGEYDIYLGSRTGATTANDPVVLNDFYSPTAASTNHFSNPRVDELLEQGLAAAGASEAELNQIYGEVQEIVWTEAPWAFLYYQPELVAISERLKGFQALPDEMYYFTEAYVE
jgi:peptide/nickel transport system substrate-binding protein